MGVQRHSWPRLISVLIPARNAEATIAAQIYSLRSQTYDGLWEAILVNNGSTDSTVKLALDAAGGLPLRVVDASERPGLSYARNVGVASARGDFVAFCDADDEVAPGWLAAL